MLYIRKLFTQDLRNGKQIAFPKEVSYSFFSFDYINKEEDRKITFTFRANFGQFQEYDGKEITTRLYAAGSESRMDGEVKAFIRDELKAQVNDLLIFKSKGTKHIDYDVMFVPQSNKQYYSLLLNISFQENHSVYTAEEEKLNCEEVNSPLQQIYYGCPGSGKSHKVNGIVGDNVFRTTFHPDTDYASFVGCYKPHTQASENIKKQLVLDYDGLVEKFKEYLEVKPTNITKACTLFGYDYYESIVKMQEDNVHTIPVLVAEAYKDGSTYDSQVRAGMSVYETSTPVKSSEKSIVYEFCPQVFTNAYVQAWKNTEEKVYLIIEEINRGNCAQIFGDLFQLLDRNDEGYSEYKVTADKDLADYLKGVLGAEHEGIKDGKLCLPPNLIIYATMNTSDQSLFPMDSAFKRRWDWEYVPIEYGADKKSYNFIITIGDKEYRWVEFLKIVNEKIYDATNSEDKQMGNFFIKKSIDAATFVNKVMFYLWNEVCKEEYGTQRNFFRKGKEGKDEFKFTELFGSNRDTILNEFMSSLNVPTLNKEPENTEA